MKWLFLLGACAMLASAQESSVEEASLESAPTDGLKCFVAEDSASGDTSTKLCYNMTSGAVTLVAVDEDVDATPQAAALATDLDVLWIIICGAMVFFMQAGFGILEAGCITEKNVINIMFKNVMDASIAGLCYWLLGYGIAYGDENDGPFIGSANFALSQESGTGFHSFFFQWAFAATAATIVAGSVAERCKLEAYFVYSVVLTVVIYPIVSHWIWDSEGWLSIGNETPLFSDTKTGPGGANGMIDFAGCAVVHMVGGWAGFVAAIVIGPRKGRFDSGAPQPHNVLFCSMGVLFLWFGWYGFNCGSTLGVSGGVSHVAARVATTTTISAASGCVTAAILSRAVYGHYDLLFALNGILAGLVSITAACFCVEPWAACVIGIIGSFVYKGASLLLQKMKIDDPLDAAPVHGACGIFGALAPGIFSNDALLKEVLGNDNDAVSSGKQFLTQLVGVLAVLVWVLVTSAILFYGIHATIGLRVSEEVEDMGLDQSEHGGKAYNVQKDTKLESEAVELQAKA